MGDESRTFHFQQPIPQRQHASEDRYLGGVVGGCLGGFLGGFAGTLLGGGIGFLLVERLALREMVAFRMLLLGPVLGGLIGFVAGAALIVGQATRRLPSAAPDTPPAVVSDTSAAASAPATESAEAELARLRDRIAELERKEQTGQREDANHPRNLTER